MRVHRRIVASIALTAATSASAVRADDTQPAPLAPLQPTIVEYRWTFLVPEWVSDSRIVETTANVPQWRSRRVEFGSLEFTTTRRRIASVPEFDCKYVDFVLPNACRTTWRDVYVEVYVPVVRPDSFDVDVPEWSREEVRTRIDVPRLIWKEQTLLVSLPALASPPAPSR